MIRVAEIPCSQPSDPCDWPQDQILDHIVWFKRDDATAIAPTTSEIYSLGLNLHSPIDVVIPAKSVKIIDTKLNFIFPKGFHGLISSTDGDNPSTVMVLSSLLQSDFRSHNAAVRIFNTRDYDYPIARGEPIAMLFLQKSYFYGMKQTPSDFCPPFRGMKRKSNEYG
jgi:dUTPase